MTKSINVKWAIVLAVGNSIACKDASAEGKEYRAGEGEPSETAF